MSKLSSGEWWERETKNQKLFQLVDEYHQRCDEYDRIITGRADGFPVTRDQRRQSVRNAWEVERELCEKAQALGYDKETWRAARRRATPRS